MGMREGVVGRGRETRQHSATDTDMNRDEDDRWIETILYFISLAFRGQFIYLIKKVNI